MLTALRWAFKWLHQCCNHTVCPKYIKTKYQDIIHQKEWVTLSFTVDNTPNVGLDHLENHQLQSKESETDKIQGVRGKLKFLCPGKYKHLSSVSQTM